MKIRFFQLSMGFLTGVVLSSCKPELKEMGEAYASGDGIYGTWQVEGVKQTDLSPPLPEAKDISAFFQSDASRKMIVRFDKEGGTYAVIQAGYLPRLLGSAGTWKYDTLPYPSTLFFMPGNGDTVKAPLRNMPREIDQVFGFSITRKDTCGKAYLTYDFTFSRQ